MTCSALVLLAGSASGAHLGASRVGAARPTVRPFAPRHIRAEPEAAAPTEAAPRAAMEPEPEDDGMTSKQREVQRLRDAEVFMVKDTGRYECRTCSYVFDPAKGDGLSARAAAPRARRPGAPHAGRRR